MTDLGARRETVLLVVDGNEVHAGETELLIDACERTGTYIPRFCHHPRMKPVGMCRMCLVEVDVGRGRSLQPSCMVTVADNMQVYTDSELTRKAQDGVLEFLLANHPLDCPVCDKGGECPLQDQTMAYGPGESRFVESKRHFEKPIPISDTVYLDRERCILCDRCTRFADQVAGDPLIHFMDRGYYTEVNTYPDEPFSSYFSGNTVQICPVGALTAKPYRFKARPWDLAETVSTAWVDAVGSRITVQSSRNKVLRLLGIDADPVNRGWLSDKERFAFEALNSDQRITGPLRRSAQTGDLEPVGWGDAMAYVASLLADINPERVAVIGGARLTNESQYAWAKLAKGVIGTDHVDAQLDDGLPAELVLGLPRATINEACQPGGTILLLGPDPKEDLGALYLRLRHAILNDDVTLIELTPHGGGLSGIAAHSLHPVPGELAALAAALVAAIGDPGPTPAFNATRVPASAIAAAAAAVHGPVTVVLGRASIADSAQGVIEAALALNELADVKFLSALRRGNVHGALDAGLAPGLLPGRTTLEMGADRFGEHWNAIPSATGLDTAQILAASAAGLVDVLILLGSDPLNDFRDRAEAQAGLAGASTVIAVDILPNDSTRGFADVVLAAAGPTEVDGTFTNLEGRVSVSCRRVDPPGTARPDWMIAAMIAESLGADLGVDSVAALRDELYAVSTVHRSLNEQTLTGELINGVLISGPGDIGLPEVTEATIPVKDAYSLRLVATRRMYDGGTLVAHSPASAGLVCTMQLRLNPTDFAKLGVQPATMVRLVSLKGALTTPVFPDGGVPAGSAVIPAFVPGSPANQLINASTHVTDVRVERL